MKCAYERELDNRATDRTGKDFLTFFDLSTGIYLHKHLGFGKKRLERFYEESYTELFEAMEHFSGDNENDRDQMADALIGVRGRLKAVGIDTKNWEDEYLKKCRRYKVYHHMGNKKLTTARMDFVDHAWMVAVTYYTVAVKILHDQCGFGDKRAHELYDELRKDYDAFVQLFLMCSRTGDEAIQKVLTDYRKQIEDIGITIQVKWSED